MGSDRRAKDSIMPGCWQMLAPPHSLHVLLCRRCLHLVPPRARFIPPLLSPSSPSGAARLLLPSPPYPSTEPPERLERPHFLAPPPSRPLSPLPAFVHFACLCRLLALCRCSPFRHRLPSPVLSPQPHLPRPQRRCRLRVPRLLEPHSLSVQPPPQHLPLLTPARRDQ